MESGMVGGGGGSGGRRHWLQGGWLVVGKAVYSKQAKQANSGRGKTKAKRQAKRHKAEAERQGKRQGEAGRQAKVRAPGLAWPGLVWSGLRLRLRWAEAGYMPRYADGGQVPKYMPDKYPPCLLSYEKASTAGTVSTWHT